MDMPQEVTKIQQDAHSLARAAQYMGKAAHELVPVVAPAARGAIARLPGAVGAAASRIRALTPERLRRDQRLGACICGVAAAGLTAAAIAHVVHHRKVAGSYREHQRMVTAAKARERDIVDALALAQEHYRAEDFEHLYEDSGDEGLYGLDAPGCFALLAFDPDPENGDFSGYRDCYVGASKDMARGAHRQLSGKGNLYVHADVVYGQPLYVLFFPCEEYELYARRERLIAALGSDESYNKISDLAELD